MASYSFNVGTRFFLVFIEEIKFVLFFITFKISSFSAKPIDLTWTEISLLESSCCNTILSGDTLKMFPKSAVQSSFDSVKLVPFKFGIVTREVNIKISRKEKKEITFIMILSHTP